MSAGRRFGRSFGKSGCVRRFCAFVLVLVLALQMLPAMGSGLLAEVVLAANGYAYSYAEAAAIVREGLVNREESISVTYVSDEYDDTASLYIWEEALAHTGVGDEGDYLLLQYNSMSGSGSYSTIDGQCYETIKYTVSYSTTAEQEAAVTARLAEVYSELGLVYMSDYEKVCAIYDYICQNVEYAYTDEGDGAYEMRYTAYGALINGYAVCQGYTALFYRMALDAGVDVRCITGTDSYSGAGHAWNIVLLGDYYYNVDTTWDAAAVSGYSYFLKCDENFDGHVRYDDYSTDVFYSSYPMASEDCGDFVLGSGSCGDSLTWTMYEDGVLTIRGMGDLADENPGYGDYLDEILGVRIGEGVTSIAAGAFSGAEFLCDIVIPESVTSISDSAFDGCSSWLVVYGYTGSVAETYAAAKGYTFVALASGSEGDSETESTETEDTETENTEAEVTILYSGTDSHIEWSIDSNGLLTLSGTGNYSNHAWTAYSSYIKSAVVNITGITTTAKMFYNCAEMESIDLSGLDTSKVTLYESMFNGCSSLISLDVSNFDTSLAQYMTSMFANCSSLTSLDVSSFDTSNVTLMAGMFSNCSSLISLDLSNFDTSKVTDMHALFYDCSSLTSLDISSFDTSNVTRMSQMFMGCSSLTSLDVSSFDTSSVTNMYNMFHSCSSLTSLDVSSFDVSNVTSIDYMFAYCSSLTSLNLGEFHATSASDMQNLFANCSSLTELDLSGFTMGSPGYMGSMFFGCSSLTSLDVSNFDTSNAYTLSYMFYGCTSLTDLDVSSFDTSNTAIFAGMFRGCSALTSLDVSGFDTSFATDMTYMFASCEGLTSLDVSGFNTSGVTSMYGMFVGCTGLTIIDVSGFDTSNVTNMMAMFSGCTSVASLDVSGFDTSLVTSISGMFSDCWSLTSLDLSSFDFSGVSSVASFLGNCYALEKVVAPAYVTKAISFPSNSEYTWLNENGESCSSIAVGLDTAMTYTREIYYSIYSCEITLDSYEFTYDGTAKEPAVTVKYGDTVLQEGTDYTLSYNDNVDAYGITSVDITGCRNCFGTRNVSFWIYAADQTVDVALSQTDIYVGDQVQIMATANATEEFTYDTDNRNVFTVSDTGVITAVSAGTAVLSVTAESSTSNYKSTTVTLEITVLDNATSGEDDSESEDPGEEDDPDAEEPGTEDTEEPGTEDTEEPETEDAGTESTEEGVKASLSSCTLSVSVPSYTYDGTAKKPSASDITVTVKDADGNTVSGSHYTVSCSGWSNYTNAGTATVKVTVTAVATGSYTGSVSKTVNYTIAKATQKISVKTKGSTSIKTGASTTWTAKSSGNGSITYTCVSTKGSSVATVKSSTGKVTGKNVGTVEVYAQAAATTNYKASSRTLIATIKVTLNTPTISSVKQSGKTVTVKWAKITGASGYYVYRSTSKNGTYSKVKTITSGTTVSYSDTAAKSNGKTYYYKVYAYSGSTKSSASSVKSLKYMKGSISGLTNTASGITVKWSKVSGATGYYIYRKAGSGSYSKVKTITSGSTVSWTDSGVKSKNGTTYTYYVQPYNSTSKGYYATKKTVRLTAVSVSSVTNSATKSLTVKYKKNSKASGYQIQYSTSKTFASGNKTVTVSGASTLSRKITKLTKGKTYYVRVRAYKTVSGTKYYSAWSSKKSVKVSK